MGEKEKEKEKFKVGDIYTIQEVKGYQIVVEVDEKTGEPLILNVDNEVMAWLLKSIAEIKEKINKSK